MKLSLLAYRAFGAATLDAGTYEGLEHDTAATGQAALVVIVSSLAAGVGASGYYGPSLSTVALCTGVALVTWLAWAALTLNIGTRILPEADTHADLGELLRTVGFAAAPGVLQVFAAFPGATVFVFAASWLWMFLAMVVAVKHALDYTRVARALAVCALGAALIAAVAIVFGRTVS